MVIIYALLTILFSNENEADETQTQNKHGYPLEILEGDGEGGEAQMFSTSQFNFDVRL